jgi:MFS family permease
MIAAVIGIVFKPLAGRWIDRFGEKSVLVADGLALVLVCLGYGYATQLTRDPASARLLASACFILDNLLFSLGAGRAVYVSRLAESPQELTSTLSLGISINHIVSMTIPPVAGVVWVVFGYQKVFLAAAVLAFAISAFASLVPPKAENLSAESGSGD